MDVRTITVCQYKVAPSRRAPSEQYTISELIPSRLHVGGIPYKLPKEGLLRLFSRIGRVDDVLIAMDGMSGRSKGFGSVRMSDDAATMKAATLLNGVAIQEDGSLLNEEEALGREPSKFNMLISKVSQTIAMEVANNPHVLQQLEWRDLERMLKEVFDGIGYVTTLTPANKDGGKDLILQFLGQNKCHSYFVEIKHWVSGKRVGRSAVKEFFDIVVKERQDGGLFLATSGFTPTVFESMTSIDRERITLGDGDTIVSLCAMYQQLKSGVWAPTINLQELLRSGIG